jgi:selenocysteine lyase/cysteine desulfurase
VRAADRFDLDPSEIYLDGAYCSPLPRAARAAVEEAYVLKAHPSRIRAEEFFGYVDAVRDRLARVLGVPDRELAITTGTGGGAVLLAQAIRWRSGDRLLIGPDEFPSNVYPWQALAERGVHVEFIGERGRPLTVDHLEAALAAGPVRLLTVGAVHYLTGAIHPLADFAARLAAQGGLMVVDATQAAGSVAIDWPATGAAAFLTSGYKWLFGPYGTGAMWVRTDLLESLANVNGNWWATTNARDFRRVLDYSEFPVHGRRFDACETASFLNLGAWRAGLDSLLGEGIAAIEARQRALQDRLVAGLAGTPLAVLTPLDAPHRSPMLYLETRAGTDIARVHEALAARGVRVSLRASGLRVSPGRWNDEADIDGFLQAIASAR